MYDIIKKLFVDAKFWYFRVIILVIVTNVRIKYIQQGIFSRKYCYIYHEIWRPYVKKMLFLFRTIKKVLKNCRQRHNSNSDEIIKKYTYIINAQLKNKIVIF